MKKKIVAMLLLCLVIFGTITGCNSEKTYYEKGVAEQEKGNYDGAVENLKQAGEYEDAKERLKECQHLKDVENDTTPPVINGIKEGAIIEVEYGQKFNLENYLSETVAIEDDVSGDLTQFSFSISEQIMNANNADIDTTQGGEYPVALSISDEAGNESVVNFVLKIKALHISKENPHPVIYEGEYGKITLSDIRYGREKGVQGYHFTFNIENRTQTDMVVSLGDAYINNTKISTYTDLASIEAGRNGAMESNIRDEDMTAEMEGFTQIESKIRVSTSVLFGETYLSIPVIIDRDVVN